MAVGTVVVEQFYPDGDNIYTVKFDVGIQSMSFSFSGSSYQTSFSDAQRGHDPGTPIGEYTDGVTQWFFFSSSSAPFATFTSQPYNEPLPPTECSIEIDSVTVTDETYSFANDGTVIISSDFGVSPISYSIDNVSYQSNPLFISLAPGNYTAYARDVNGCVASEPFTIQPFDGPPTTFSDGLPIVEVPTGNVSRWSAVFNPIFFKYQRRDFDIETVTQISATQVRVSLGVLLTSLQIANSAVGASYIKTSLYEFSLPYTTYQEVSGVSTFIFNYPYLGDDMGGFINLFGFRTGFKIQTEITSGDDPVTKRVITAEHYPNGTGLTRADISSYLRSYLSAAETNDFLQTNYRDYGLAISYTVRYREVWDGGTSIYRSAPYPFYATFAAMQLGEKYGGNMAQYVPFMQVSLPQDKAKWLTDMKSPTMWKGLPFELSFIYSENVINESLVLELIPDCGEAEDSLLLNADATFLLNADASRFVIERTYNPDISGFPIIAKLGVNRVMIPPIFDCCATKITANIYYMDGSTKVYIMQPIVIKHICECTDPYVYLKWINHVGAWDFWRYGYNQVLTSDSSDSQQVSRFVSDWENGDTLNDLISRSANDKLQILSGQVDKDTLKALRWSNNSIKAQMLIGTNPIKWQTVIIPDGAFSAYNTKDGSANVKLNITLADKNIQSQ